MVSKIGQWLKAKSPKDNFLGAYFISGCEQAFSSTEENLSMMYVWVYRFDWQGKLREDYFYSFRFIRDEFEKSSFEEWADWVCYL